VELIGVLGHGLPSAFFALGFLPQLRVFVKAWSVAGYSFGITILDVVGSAANTYVLLRTGGGWAEALPFLTIIGLHGVLVALAVWILLTARGGCGASEKGTDPPASAAAGA